MASSLFATQSASAASMGSKRKRDFPDDNDSPRGGGGGGGGMGGMQPGSGRTMKRWRNGRPREEEVYRMCPSDLPHFLLVTQENEIERDAWTNISLLGDQNTRSRNFSPRNRKVCNQLPYPKQRTRFLHLYISNLERPRHRQKTHTHRAALHRQDQGIPIRLPQWAILSPLLVWGYLSSCVLVLARPLHVSKLEA